MSHLWHIKPSKIWYHQELEKVWNYVDEGHVELFGRVAARQVASHIEVVVLDDARHYVRRGHTLCEIQYPITR